MSDSYACQLYNFLIDNKREDFTGQDIIKLTNCNAVHSTIRSFFNKYKFEKEIVWEKNNGKRYQRYFARGILDAS